MRLFHNLCLAALTLVILMTLLEISFRIYLSYFAEETTFLTYASLHQIQNKYGAAYLQTRKYTPHRYIGYYPTPNYQKKANRHNALGYRGEEIPLPKPDGEFRIVCLGGSTTYTGHIDDYRLSYPALLEQALHAKGHSQVRVINAGASGWSSWETLINFELRVLDLAPDLIIFYHGINDIHPRLVWPPEAYQGDNSGRRIANYSQLFMPGIAEYSTVLRFFMIRFGMILPHAALSQTISREPETYHGTRFREQQTAGVYPQGIFQQTPAADMLAVNTPKYFKRNIENIIAIAKQHNVKTVLATFAYSPLFTNIPRVSSPEYVAAYAEMNQVLKSIAAAQAVDLFDFAARFPTDRRYYTDGRHVTEEGARLKAALFADYVLSGDLLK